MLYDGKESLMYRPKLRSGIDKLFRRYPDQEPFWDAVIRKYPEWKPEEQIGWTEQVEPLSDDVGRLQSLISVSVHTRDTVLTTAIHAPFFAVKTHNVHIYDMSPIQLQQSLKRFPDVKSSWFCDVFHPPMLREIMSETHPTVLYLSNIPDYGTHEQRARLFQELHDMPYLREILCSTLCTWGDPLSLISEYLAELSTTVGYSCQEYPVNKKHSLFRFTR